MSLSEQAGQCTQGTQRTTAQMRQLLAEPILEQFLEGSSMDEVGWQKAQGSSVSGSRKCSHCMPVMYAQSSNALPASRST